MFFFFFLYVPWEKLHPKHPKLALNSNQNILAVLCPPGHVNVR